jgi:4-amino-4-deoxy-L-arabinose transferase-like glycosyltransferase
VDYAWAAATALASGALFATIITGHPGLSDASESVAGVTSLGVLHAPGYPAYVLTAKLFTLLIPVGSAAFKVNLFSLLCASLSVAGVQLLARRCGAARWAATVGALCLAASAGFWFYAGFAKHDMFSGLAFLAALYLLLAWEARPTTWRLAALGAVLAIGLGSSWPLMVMIGPALAYVLFRSRGKVSLRSLAVATATGAVLLVVVYGFVMVRAAQNPTINWGAASNPGRLIRLVQRADFTPRSSGPPNRAGAAGASGTNQASPGLASRVATYFKIFWRELGIAGFLLAAWGLLASLRRRHGPASYPLLIVFAANLLGAAAVVGLSRSAGFDGDLVEEGFLLGCYFALACWVALGATDLLARITAVSPVGRLGMVAPAKVIVPMIATGLAAVVLVPSVTGHWSVAHRSANGFADSYANTVFAELPPRAVVFVWGSDLNLPLTYRQVVYHERPDVVVIAVGGLRYDWYRQQLSRVLGRSLPPQAAGTVLDTARVMRSLTGVRPVYMDQQAIAYLSGTVGSRMVGLVAELEPGTQPVPASSPAALEQTVLAAERAAGIPNPAWNGWPNVYLAQAAYSTAALRVAGAYYQHHDLVGMRRALRNVLSVQPGDPIANRDLALLNSSGAGG